MPGGKAAFNHAEIPLEGLCTEMHPLLWMICSEPEMGQAMVGSRKLHGDETS